MSRRLWQLGANEEVATPADLAYARAAVQPSGGAVTLLDRTVNYLRPTVTDEWTWDDGYSIPEGTPWWGGDYWYLEGGWECWSGYDDPDATELSFYREDYEDVYAEVTSVGSEEEGVYEVVLDCRGETYSFSGGLDDPIDCGYGEYANIGDAVGEGVGGEVYVGMDGMLEEAVARRTSSTDLDECRVLAPAVPQGRVSDCMLCLDLSGQSVAPSGLEWGASGDNALTPSDVPEPEAGKINLYSFTGIMDGVVAVSLKKLDPPPAEEEE